MTATAELLIEIRCEEIPARMQEPGRLQFQALLEKALTAENLTYTSLKTYVTPQRLIAVVVDLLKEQPDRSEERRGPRIDAPEKAIQGFLTSVGVSSIESCEKRETPKGTFLFVDQFIKGEKTAERLPALLNEILGKIDWPKSMRWASHTFPFVRPLRGIVCVFGGELVEGALDLGGASLSFTNRTQGHRFMAPDTFGVSDFKDYAAKLQNARVLFDQEVRKSVIEASAQALADPLKLRVRKDLGLLEEVNGLVEFPSLFLGKIDEAFMDLPPEVLTTAMRVHQRYFALETPDGKLAPYFIIAANIDPTDGGAALIAGNEKVLRARLSDAQFFYDLDQKKPLSDHAVALEKVIFHAHLGTMAEKTHRIADLAAFVTEEREAPQEDLKNAALLAKADLTTEMVGEFPELQGLMGGYYAHLEGYNKTVVQAITQHYAPRGPQEELPDSMLGKAIALADKIDTLTGFFAVGIQPTGSKDPFALRRAALGVVRLAECFPGLKLSVLCDKAYDLYTPIFKRSKKEEIGAKERVLKTLQTFFLDRLTVYWRAANLRHDFISAAFSVGGEDPIGVLRKRVQALACFMTREDGVGVDLLAAYRRAINIVRIEEKKDQIQYDDTVRADLFQAEEEKNLYRALQACLEKAPILLSDHDFNASMELLAGLRPDIDTFFDQVKVNADSAEVRVNRLKLLSLIRSTLEKIADFSKIEG